MSDKIEWTCEGCGKSILTEVGNPYCDDCYARWLDDSTVQARKAWKEREQPDDQGDGEGN